jgi:hemerythrin-like domain-containing protein
MKPTEILAGEHSLIRQALDNFSLSVVKLETGERPSKEFFEGAVQFARVFADKYHHFKEEYLMFGLLAQKKNGELDSQIDSLKHQHERSRNLVSAMANSIDGYVRGDDAHATLLLENMAAYTSLLRHHIHREDHVFYPMVDKELSQAEQKSLLNEFKKEEQKQGGKTFKECEKLVKKMGSLL